MLGRVSFTCEVLFSIDASIPIILGVTSIIGIVERNRNNRTAENVILTGIGHIPSEIISITSSHLQTVQLPVAIPEEEEEMLPDKGPSSSTTFQALLLLSRAEFEPTNYAVWFAICSAIQLCVIFEYRAFIFNL